MGGLRILITNNTLGNRAGSELYVRDLGIALLRRGHTPIAYSTSLGEVARDLRAATIPVIDDLDLLATPPDIIHGHHHLDTMTALLRFPGVPAVYFCHGWIPWEEAPPRFPRILRYVAVDHTCRDRLVFEHAIPENRVRVLLNFVDLERFKPRAPLPIRPRLAVVFSNQANEYTHPGPVRQACARFGITVDVIGLSAGNACARPEEVLGNYDIVFAKARAALEALAVGAAVVLCDETGAGPMVTTDELDRLRPLNFGIRTLRNPLDADVLAAEIARYDPADAAEVSRRIRASAGLDTAVDEIISLYQEVISEYASASEDNADDEQHAASRYLRWLTPDLKRVHTLEARANQAVSERDQAVAERDGMKDELAKMRVEHDQLSAEHAELRRQLAEQHQVRDQFEQTIAERDSISAELAGDNAKLNETSDECARLQGQLTERERDLLAFEARLKRECEQHEQQLANKEAVIQGLSSTLASKEAQLEGITSSLGWRLLNRYGPIKHRFLLPIYRRIRSVL
ncbi:MAG TPA: glycosyltransferase [Blastocatellia bacterium]